MRKKTSRNFLKVLRIFGLIFVIAALALSGCDVDGAGLSGAGGGQGNQGGGQGNQGGGNDNQGGGNDNQGGGNDNQGGGNDNQGGGNDNQGGGNDNQGGGNDNQGGGNDNQGGGNDNQGGGNDNQGGGNDNQGGGNDNQGGGNDNQGGGQDDNQGGGQDDNQGGGQDDNQGGGQDDNQGGGQDDNQGGGQDDNQGGGQDDNQGGGQDDNQGGGQDDNQGGGQDDNQGGGQDDNQGGGQDDNQGGGQDDNQGGGQDNQGGGQDDNQGGGQTGGGQGNLNQQELIGADTKWEEGSGNEFESGNVTTSGSGDQFCWSAEPGTTVTGVSIKIGGPGGGSYIFLDNPGNEGCWENSYKYAISHAVVYTDDVTPPPPPPEDPECDPITGNCDDNPPDPPGHNRIPICHATGSETNPYVLIVVPENSNHFDEHTGHGGDIIPAPDEGCPGPPPPPNPPDKVNVCHATGSEKNPFVFINVSVNAATGLHGHEGHAGDVIGATSADDCPGPPPPEKITLCHATGSATNPYVEITVSYNAVDGHGHGDHADDIIPMPAEGCPGAPPEPEEISLCHATGDENNPYVELSISYDPAVGHGHENHGEDISPVPADGCPTAPPPEEITLCHATGNENRPYVEVSVSYNAADGHGHENHADDIIPMTDDSCPGGPPPPTPTPTPTDEPSPEPVPNVPVNFTVPPADPPDPATCPQFIIFHTFRDENLEVYRMDGIEGAGAQLYNLSNSGAVDSRPSRSPNDQWVVFESDRDGNVELYYTDSLGTQQVRLTYTNANNINPMFGPDNQSVVFQSDRNGNWDIFIVNIETGVERQLTTNVNDDIRPYWSPDGQWVVFESDRDGSSNILIVNVETGEERQVSRSLADETFPSWSPNGRQLAFISNVNNAWELFVSNIDGSEVVQITQGGDARNHAWSPEGDRLAYQYQFGRNVDVFTYDLNNSVNYRLSDYPGADSSPTWDCGGSQISFTSTRDGNPNVLQVFWQGGPQSNLTVNNATDKWSQWSPSNEQGSEGY